MIGVFIPTEPGKTEATAVKLTALDLASFVGGQAEIHLEGGIMSGGKVFRGDIASIDVTADELVLRFSWLGVMETVGVWKADQDLELRLGILLLESCELDAQGRVVIQAPIVDQMLVLFPPSYTVDGEARRLLRETVEGA